MYAWLQNKATTVRPAIITYVLLCTGDYAYVCKTSVLPPWCLLHTHIVSEILIYVYMSVYIIYIYIYIYTHTHKYMYIYVCVYMCVYVSIHFLARHC
jgi:hypothetical protein